MGILSTQEVKPPFAVTSFIKLGEIYNYAVKSGPLYTPHGGKWGQTIGQQMRTQLVEQLTCVAA